MPYTLYLYSTITLNSVISKEIIFSLKMCSSPVPSKVMNNISIYRILQTSRNLETIFPFPPVFLKSQGLVPLLPPPAVYPTLSSSSPSHSSGSQLACLPSVPCPSRQILYTVTRMTLSKYSSRGYCWKPFSVSLKSPPTAQHRGPSLPGFCPPMPWASNPDVSHGYPHYSHTETLPAQIQELNRCRQGFWGSFCYLNC